MTTILAFESSCDETAVALLDFESTNEIEKYNFTHKLHSQIAVHREYGGVVPELAARDHIRLIKPLTEQILTQAQKKYSEIDYLAYTAGPGLAGALMVAGGFTNSLAYALQKPIIPIHHLEGHILSPLLSTPTPEFPYIALLVSGGHSQIYEVTCETNVRPAYKLLGESVDDAAGEAFDKTAKLLGLPYPGGQYLEEMAKKHTPDKNCNIKKLPRPMITSGDLQMSFSGLKTAVWHRVREAKEEDYPAIAHQFQEAIVEVLVSKTLRACQRSGINNLAVCGGVARNRALYNAFIKTAQKHQLELFFTPLEYCTDNAVMIALAASFNIERAQISDGSFNIKPHWKIN